MLAQTFYDPTGRARDRWLHVFRYNRSMAASMGLFVIGTLMAATFAIRYIIDGFSFEGDVGDLGYVAITGVMFMMLGFMAFAFTLLLHASAIRWPLPDAVEAP